MFLFFLSALRCTVCPSCVCNTVLFTIFPWDSEGLGCGLGYKGKRHKGQRLRSLQGLVQGRSHAY